MPDVNKPETKPSEKKRFINEKIVRPPMSKKQMVRRGVVLVAAAIIFGAVASASFVFSIPIAQKYLGQEPTEESTAITYPKDEPETASQVTPGEIPAETIGQETEPIEDILQSAIEKYQYSMDDLIMLFGNMRAVYQEADKGIVTVHSVKQQMDWFDNPVESTGLYAGAVIASTNEELLVITPEGAVEDADTIKVTLADGTEVNGYKKQNDTVSGLAIVSIPVSELEKNTLDSIVSLELGNSFTVRQGDMVLAIGSPAGMVHSLDIGFIQYVAKNIQVADSTTRLIYTDMQTNAQMGTFLINTSGAIVGWITDSFKPEGGSVTSVAMAISDYKPMLDKLSNGNSVPYVGIKGQEVSAEMMSKGLPAGLYIASVITDGPAYSAGIQNGDIITQIGEKKITTMKDYQVCLETLASGDEIKVSVQRNGRDEYKEIEFLVTVGAR